ncbi:P-loop ATPase, Sll1717 family [Novosphingobium piscinae]|uniref:ATPase n=1 Tax=Novosphingobium piscinae TaxID=1507448 RepID=A0A7X1KNY7_9SPHN|nr:hypothetical protein [Novosphingobium piscinae]MBC2667933.1 hypothetical protein [Novosphingobium piscinae]
MTTAKELLTKMRLGTSVAEFDEDLENYFVRTNVFHEFINGRKDIIAGDKGTGKTAIFRYLNKNFSLIEELDGKLLIAAFNPSGSPIFSQLSDQNIINESQYSSLWKLYIFALVGNTIIQGDTRLEGSQLDLLLKALGVRIAIPSPKNVFGTVLSRLPNFFHWKSAELSMTISESGIPIIVPKIEFADRDEKGSSSDFVSPEDALAILDRTVSESGQEIWVSFDRLDEAFHGQPDTEVKALRALLRTYLDLSDLEAIKLKLFLRKDLFRRVTSGGFVNLTHINAKKIEIIWDEEDLLNLLARRIRENSDFSTTLGIDNADDQAIFDRIFPDQVDLGSRKPKTWIWMMRRIRDGNDSKPPRNLIDLISHAREAQIRKEDRQTRDFTSSPLIEPDALRKGLTQLSQSRVNDTLIAESGILSLEIEKFRGGKAEHNATSLSYILGTSEDNVMAAIKPLRDIGFLEETGGTFKIPALYREGLEVTQGKAFQDDGNPEDDD